MKKGGSGVWSAFRIGKSLFPLLTDIRGDLIICSSVNGNGSDLVNSLSKGGWVRCGRHKFNETLW